MRQVICSSKVLASPGPFQALGKTRTCPLTSVGFGSELTKEVQGSRDHGKCPLLRWTTLPSPETPRKARAKEGSPPPRCPLPSANH